MKITNSNLIAKILNKAKQHASAVSWNTITGKPTSFTPSEHSHNYLSDAPSDDNEYVRKNGTWAQTSASGGGLTRAQILAIGSLGL